MNTHLEFSIETTETYREEIRFFKNEVKDRNLTLFLDEKDLNEENKLN